MALEVIRAFSREHVRWLESLEEYALRKVKDARVRRRKEDPAARKLHDAVIRALCDADCWMLCDCLPDGLEQPVIVPGRGRRSMRLGNLPDASVPHAGNCVFRLQHLQGASRFFFNPLSHERDVEASAERDLEHKPWSGTGRSVPVVAYMLKCFIREARLHTLAGVERFPSSEDWLAELRRAAVAFPVAPGVPASEVLCTAPASWHSGEFRERLDERARHWPKDPPPCGYLCWVAHDVEGHDINGRTGGAGHVRVTSPVVSRLIHNNRVEGPYLFLGALAQSADMHGWECRMAYAEPIAAPELPIPVDSDYERQALLSLARLVEDLRSGKELREALGGVVRVELERPLFPIRVRDGRCHPDGLLTVSRPGGSTDGSDKVRYVIEVMGLGSEEYEKKKEETHRLMKRIGRVIRLEGGQFGSAHNGLERQRDRIARQISKDLLWRWT